jgi:signal transduction histidine kinase
MALGSLRSRLIVGALLWTIGILAIAVALATAVVFRHPHWRLVLHHAMLLVVAAVCAAAGLTQLRRGMSPINQLRSRLGAIRTGASRQVDGTYPAEVQPLVTELNALLEERERRVAHALAQAGDLAHGLKTPLALLAQDAARALAAGEADLADSIAEQVTRMRRQMDYHLAQARAAVSGTTPGVRSSLKVAADALARTLLKLHADRGLRIEVDIPAEHMVRARLDDLEEMLGNLLDNACTWARSRVTVVSVADGASVMVTIDDDGTGIPESLRETVLQRGVRADEAAAGSGFGLAIVREVAELYGGSITLGSADSGGARARLILPRADTS